MKNNDISKKSNRPISGDKEHVIKSAEFKNFSSFHWVVFFVSVIVIMISAGNLSGQPVAAGALITAMIVGLLALIFALQQLGMAKNELTLTNKRLTGKIGFLSTKSMDSPLDKIQNVSISQGLLGKIIGYSTIFVNNSSGSFEFKQAVNAEGFRNSILSEIEKYKESVYKNRMNQELSSYNNNVKNDDPMDKLKKLKELYASGILTEAEYNQKRAELLKKI